MVKITNFEVVRLTEPADNRPVVLIYALGENGVLYEMAGGRWVALTLDDNIPTLAEVRAENEQRALLEQQQPPRSRIIKPNRDNNHRK